MGGFQWIAYPYRYLLTQARGDNVVPVDQCYWSLEGYLITGGFFRVQSPSPAAGGVTMIYVFHENQVTELVDTDRDTIYPYGSFILERETHWYKKAFTSCIPINRCDIPSWVKALCLIGGIKP